MRWEAWVIVCWYIVNLLFMVGMIGRRKSNAYYTAGEAVAGFIGTAFVAILVVRLGML